MLQSDVFLNILKYLDVYRWPKYINLNKKMRDSLFQKIELIKRYFRKNQYPKIIFLYKFRVSSFVYERQKFIILYLTSDEYYYYREIYFKKYGRWIELPFDKSRGKYLIDFEFFDEELYLQLYKKMGVSEEDTTKIAKIPYEYYIHGCYIKSEIFRSGGSSYEKLELQRDKLTIIKYEKKIKLLEKENRDLKKKIELK